MSGRVIEPRFACLTKGETDRGMNIMQKLDAAFRAAMADRAGTIKEQKELIETLGLKTS